MLFKELFWDKQKRDFFAWFLLNFVTEVTEASEEDVSFLFEGEVKPFDELSPDCVGDLRFSFDSG